MDRKRCEAVFQSSSRYVKRHQLDYKTSYGLYDIIWTGLTDKVFGPPPKDHATSALPQHGFARISSWEYLGKSSSEGADQGVRLDFGLTPGNLSADVKKAWPYDFSLQYSVTLGKDSLQTMLSVRNQGDKPFDFQMLLHSYFRVAVRLLPSP